MKLLLSLMGTWMILGFMVESTKIKKLKNHREKNITKQASLNEIKRFLSYKLERRKLFKIINQKRSGLRSKKSQSKGEKGRKQYIFFSATNSSYSKKAAVKNNTDEGERLFHLGMKIFQQSKSQLQKKQAYLLFAKAANIGNLKAMEKMAEALLFGDLYSQNITAATALFEFLVEDGSHEAQNALGFLSSYGIGVEYNQAKALLYYTFGGIGGNMMSQMILGYRYWAGINVQKNCEVALVHYRKVASFIASKLEKNEGIPVEKVRLTERPENLSSNSEILDWDIYQYYKFLAERGDIQIQVSLGQLHLIGRKGLEQDFYKALYYFLKAAKAGSTNAMAFLGMMYLEGNAAAPQNNATAFKYFSMAANKGNAIGFYGLGLLYFHGKGIPVNYVEAFKYFQKAAEKGWPNAQFQLGFMYYFGLGVWKDYKLAFKYFYLASQSGQPLAIYYLGEMYASGIGVLRSCQTAVEFYKGVCELGFWAEKFLTAYFAYKDGDIDSSLVQYALLAEMGYEVAQSNTAFILESKSTKIIGEDQMYPLALLLWNRAAAQGNAHARVKIGDYYFYGYGTKKDYLTAATHYGIAAEKHHSAQAMFNLGYMYEHGLGVTKDIHLAKKLYNLAAKSNPDASVPVFFALMKLEAVDFLRHILLFNFTMRWKWLKLDNTFGPYWDLFMIGIITALLTVLLRNRQE
ncbi:protein sel-1 homolog 2 isoform X7 [Ornithorhynchus anatinus]|uniref:SEL1L2 adaptor subunit of SYVN1 ubiquitin ligase n=1 Tax=Ornithorhynchus anatinus TaxID=9258 RepID=F6QFX3_ORNAN|nr:protein sel-1 homolog 2 isoform X7 [Ornithorhynchus anatinus]